MSAEKFLDLCKSCHCMTWTIKGSCGKCGTLKPIYLESAKKDAARTKEYKYKGLLQELKFHIECIEKRLKELEQKEAERND